MGFFLLFTHHSHSVKYTIHALSENGSYYMYKTRLILVNPLGHVVRNSIDSMINVSYIWHSFNILLFSMMISHIRLFAKGSVNSSQNANRIGFTLV